MANARGRLMIEGAAATALARRFGTPLYVYSQAALRGRWEALRQAFQAPGFLLCYAIKANSNPAICRLLARWGTGAEVVSGGELLLALHSGFKPSQIVFSGVGKTREEMRAGLRAGILTFNVESEEELALLSRTAKALGRRAPVSIRVNPAIAVASHPHIATARAGSKFGVSPREALRLALKAAKSPGLRFLGLHGHLGSQIFAAAPYERESRLLISLSRELKARGVAITIADFGGGFGAEEPGRREFPLDRVSSVLRRAARAFPGLTTIIEPGRYLTAEAGTLLTTLLYRKTVLGRRLLIVDAGMNDFLRPALYGARHEIIPANPRPGPRTPADVVGPVCESTDVFGRGRRLPPVKPGDVLAVLNAGAYGFSMGSNYNSRPRPAEVLVDGRDIRLIRPREALSELLDWRRCKSP